MNSAPGLYRLGVFLSVVSCLMATNISGLKLVGWMLLRS